MGGQQGAAGSTADKQAAAGRSGGKGRIQSTVQDPASGGTHLCPVAAPQAGIVCVGQQARDRMLEQRLQARHNARLAHKECHLCQ